MNSIFTRKSKPLARSTILWVIFVVLVAAIAFLAAQPLTLRHLAHQELNVTPYTVKVESYDYQFSGGRRVKEKTVARRADGTLVEADTTLDKSNTPLLVTRKISMPDGRVVSTADNISQYVSWPPLPTERIAAAKERLLHPPANCMLPGRTFVEDGTILGYRVVALRLPQPKDSLTVWFAPDLSCEKLQVRVEQPQADGSYKLSAETKAVAVVLGEPDPALFQVPPSYTSVKPSELMKKEFERVGVPWDDNAQRGADMADANYLGRTQAQGR